MYGFMELCLCDSRTQEKVDLTMEKWIQKWRQQWGNSDADLNARTQHWIKFLEARLLPAYHAPQTWFGDKGSGLKPLARRYLWMRHWRGAVPEGERAQSLGCQ